MRKYNKLLVYINKFNNCIIQDCYCNKGDGHYIKWVIVIKKSYLSHKK